MNLEQFRYIKEVAQCRSISKAAKQLYLTQPTISNAIHNFEEEVGYKVFRRSNQGVALTEDGEKVMGSIDVILNEVQNIRNSNESPDYISGDVYVDASPAICSTIMPQVIIACKQAYPGINVHVKEGEFFTFLGPSGCGKTTTLRTLTGFIEPAEGTVIVGGKDITHVPIEDRNIGIVFQSYALFPTMTVYDNIAFGLKIKKMKKAEVDKRVREIAKKVDLSDEQLKKAVSQLSGGQQQRVAIARALVTGPAIICMDEPLSNLDAKLRVQLRNELKKMQKDFGITTIYVTHDQEEALTLSDRIAVFNSGVIEQVGTPNEVYNHSATEFVCNFIGDINRLGEGIVNELINMGAPVDPAKHNYIRLERIHVNVQPREGEIALDGTVESLEYYGLYIKYYITVCGQTIKVIEKNDGVNIYDAGQKVKAVFNPRDIMAYEPAAEAEVK